MGQISVQEVRKSVNITYFPLRLAKEKLLPFESVSFVLATTAGIGASNIVPPILAAVPEIGGGVMLGKLVEASAGTAISDSAATIDAATALRTRVTFHLAQGSYSRRKRRVG